MILFRARSDQRWKARFLAARGPTRTGLLLTTRSGTFLPSKRSSEGESIPDKVLGKQEGWRSKIQFFFFIFLFFIFFLDFGLSQLTSLQFIHCHVAGFYKPAIPQSPPSHLQDYSICNNARLEFSTNFVPSFDPIEWCL